MNIHNSTPFTDEDFADKSIDLAGNKCRNPSRSQNRLWCFIQQNGQIVKDLCHVEACGKNNVIHFSILGLQCWPKDLFQSLLCHSYCWSISLGPYLLCRGIILGYYFTLHWPFLGPFGIWSWHCTFWTSYMGLELNMDQREKSEIDAVWPKYKCIKWNCRKSVFHNLCGPSNLHNIPEGPYIVFIITDLHITNH